MTTLIRTAALCAALTAGIPAAWAQAERPQHAVPRLDLNETDLVETLRPSSLAIDDPKAVFAYVLGSLRERVQVYPTENYYYFRFSHNGVPYVGNIRLSAADRDVGKVNFYYGEAPSDWSGEPPDRHAAWGAEDGVTVTRVAPLVYRVNFADKSVTFALNDLSKVRPPDGLLAADENFLGPIFDESGLRFFLVFNARLKIFHYLLDDTAGVADEFLAAKATENIQVGKRTGFAFYRQQNRKILIGADERQSRLNTYFDGPFDQLPENFIEGDALRDAIIAADPSAKGRIDRLGHYADGSGRYLIHPYLLYRQLDDLAVFHRCVTSKSVPAAQRPRCFVIDDAEAQRPNPRPLALKRR